MPAGGGTTRKRQRALGIRPTPKKSPFLPTQGPPPASVRKAVRQNIRATKGKPVTQRPPEVARHPGSFIPGYVAQQPHPNTAPHVRERQRAIRLTLQTINDRLQSGQPVPQSFVESLPPQI